MQNDKESNSGLDYKLASICVLQSPANKIQARRLRSKGLEIHFRAFAFQTTINIYCV